MPLLTTKQSRRFRKWIAGWFWPLAYVVPLIILSEYDDYLHMVRVELGPLGPYETGRGRAFAAWFESYLLLQRGNPLDIVLFIYIWLPLLYFVGRFLIKRLSRRPATNPNEGKNEPKPAPRPRTKHLGPRR